MSKYKNNPNYDRWGNPTYDYLDSKTGMSESLVTIIGEIGFTKPQTTAIIEEISNRWGYYGVNSINEYSNENEDEYLASIANDFRIMLVRRCKMLHAKYKPVINAYDSISTGLIRQGIVYHSDIKRTPDLTHSSNNTEYALPNSKVDNIKGNPTDFNENERRETGTETHETNTEGGVNLLDQTLRYIRGMKISWVNDFVDELKPCFCTLYL